MATRRTHAEQVATPVTDLNHRIPLKELKGLVIESSWLGLGMLACVLDDRRVLTHLCYSYNAACGGRDAIGLVTRVEQNRVHYGIPVVDIWFDGGGWMAFSTRCTAYDWEIHDQLPDPEHHEWRAYPWSTPK